MATSKVQGIVVENILEVMESGINPFRIDWSSGIPYNALTEKPYNGLNAIVLKNQAPNCTAFVTRNQAYTNNLRPEGEVVNTAIYYYKGFYLMYTKGIGFVGKSLPVMSKEDFLKVVDNHLQTASTTSHNTKYDVNRDYIILNEKSGLDRLVSAVSIASAIKLKFVKDIEEFFTPSRALLILELSNSLISKELGLKMQESSEGLTNALRSLMVEDTNAFFYAMSKAKKIVKFLFDRETEQPKTVKKQVVKKETKKTSSFKIDLPVEMSDRHPVDLKAKEKAIKQETKKTTSKKESPKPKKIRKDSKIEILDPEQLDDIF